MARVGISITKSVAFRDSVQEFSNVYYYQNTAGLPDQAGALNMIDEVVTKEKAIHSLAVTFVRGRLWSQVGTKAQNEMIAQKALSGTGAAGSDASQDRERAFLIRWRAGVDTRGNPVYLRKYFHTAGQFASASGLPSSGINANQTGFTQTIRDAIATQANNLNTNTAGGGGWELVAKNGRQRTAGAAEAHKYLEHHQLGDMWRS